jgi:1-acyl-sn-glycerol-3-phosphate acyltransferase
MLPSFLADYVDAPPGPGRARVAELVQTWSEEDAAAVRQHVVGLGESPRPYPADPRCRAVSRAWCEDVVLSPRVEGAEHLDAALAAGPVLLVGNHLSYFDTQATDAALAAVGRGDLADRLVALAGPKVYEDLFRRFAASCLSTLPVPQSTQFSHTERLNARELALRARASVDAVHALAMAGRAPLLYAEGSRSRTGRLQPFLRAAWRYASLAGMRVVPLALVGTPAIMPVGAVKLTPGTVTVRVGEAIDVAAVGAREVLAVAHDAVAALLPEAHQPGA